MPHFIPEIVYLITQFLDTRDKNAASQVCRTFRENIHWTRDEYLEHLCDATARGLTSLRDSILDRYPICPQVLETVIKGGCPVTIERVLAELQKKEESHCPLELLESCDLTYTLWANIPGARQRIESQYMTLDAAWDYVSDDNYYDNYYCWQNYYEYQGLPGEGIYRHLHPRHNYDEINFFSCYFDTFDRVKYVLLRNLSNEHSELITEVRSRQTAVVKLLLSAGAKPSDKLLHLAGRDGFESVFRLLLEDGRADPSWDDHSVLLEACKNGHLGVVRLLLQDNRTPSYQDNVQLYYSLCAVASHEKQTDVMKLLLTNCGIPRWEALEFAMYKTSLVRMLLKDYNFPVTTDTVSYSLQRAKLPVVNELLTAYSRSGNPPFRLKARDVEIACCNKDVRVVRMVLSAKPELDADNVRSIVETYASKDLAKMCLLEDPTAASMVVLDDKLQKLLDRHCGDGNVEMVKALLRHPHFADIRLGDGPEPRSFTFSERHTPILTQIMQFPYGSDTLSTALYELHTPTCMTPGERDRLIS